MIKGKVKDKEGIMDNCSLRECRRCKHVTVHYAEEKVLLFHPSPYYGEGGEHYIKHIREREKCREEWRVRNTIVTHICTVCGKRWVDCETKEVWGGSEQKITYCTKQDVSALSNTVKLV